MLYTKRWMGDKSVVSIIALMPGAQAEEIRQGCNLVQGVADRRAISAKVQKQIQRYAPVCAHHGDITQQASEYLRGWCAGTLPTVRRPSTYSILKHRWNGGPQVARPGAFAPPRRFKVVDVTLDAEDAGSSSESEDEGAIE